MALGVQKRFTNPGFGEFHKMFAGTSQPITAGAERRQKFGVAQFAYNLIQTAVVAQNELALFVAGNFVFLGIGADPDVRTGVNLAEP